jgi:thiopeptide-type bacteriocin biosynthesis protein
MNRTIQGGRLLGEVQGAVKSEACLYVAVHAPRESHDRLLRELVAPIVRQIRGQKDLDSLFFIRYDDPDWQLRFRVLGRPAWVEGPVRHLAEQALQPFVDEGVIREVEFGEYAREWERYGGPLGMQLSERIFFHDSLACLDLLEAEARGQLSKSRREWSLAFTERFLDLFGFDEARRLAFYRSGHEWAFRDGAFEEEDLPRLERQYSANREGLRDIVLGLKSRDPEHLYGGSEPARIARALLDATRPVAEELLAAHAEGRVVQDLVTVVWSYAHLHCNRLGIELVPEAILRYLMFRSYAELSG